MSRSELYSSVENSTWTFPRSEMIYFVTLLRIPLTRNEHVAEQNSSCRENRHILWTTEIKHSTYVVKVRVTFVSREQHLEFSTLWNDLFRVFVAHTVDEIRTRSRENSSCRENWQIFYEQFYGFWNNYKMRAKSAGSLTECAHLLPCQHYRQNGTRVQNAQSVVFVVISYELTTPELVQDFSAFSGARRFVRVDRGPPCVPILSQMSPIHALQCRFVPSPKTRVTFRNIPILCVSC